MALLLITTAVILLANAAEPPDGWFASGLNPWNYEMTLDPGNAHTGRASGHIKAKATPGAGDDAAAGKWATLMQTATRLDAFLGKRVRMTVWVKTAEATWAVPWMRVDGRDGMAAFDNMKDRTPPAIIKGSTGWTRYEFVLDVPKDAISLNYGLMLGGYGEAWIDDVNLEAVPETVPTTDITHGKEKPRSKYGPPRNLGFEN